MFGAVLLGPALADLDWRIVLYAVLSLTLARMLPVAVAMLGTGMRRVTVAFIGWFGPRGLASIVFVLIIVEQSELTQRSLILTVVACTVALSVYAHGFSAWPGSSRYAQWYAGHTTDDADMAESVPAADHRTRGNALPQPRPEPIEGIDASATRSTAP
jgi:NhaP-type Na+/H+ or K+/H+ antiporter